MCATYRSSMYKIHCVWDTFGSWMWGGVRGIENRSIYIFHCIIKPYLFSHPAEINFLLLRILAMHVCTYRSSIYKIHWVWDTFRIWTPPILYYNFLYPMVHVFYPFPSYSFRLSFFCCFLCYPIFL